jgi:hypothetical protein
MTDDQRTKAERDDAVIAATRNRIENPPPPMEFESHTSSIWPAGMVANNIQYKLGYVDPFPEAALRTIDRLRARVAELGAENARLRTGLQAVFDIVEDGRLIPELRAVLSRKGE